MDQSNLFEQPITVEELFKALQNMLDNKSPGPDGLPEEFYKHFWDILSPLFIQLITDIKTNSAIPTRMTKAVITLLPEANKVPTHTSSYHPLSPINTDLKIIAKASATIIESVMPTIIHPPDRIHKE